MIHYHLLLCLLPLVSPQNATFLTSPPFDGPVLAIDGDPLEDFQVVPASGESADHSHGGSLNPLSSADLILNKNEISASIANFSESSQTSNNATESPNVLVTVTETLIPLTDTPGVQTADAPRSSDNINLSEQFASSRAFTVDSEVSDIQDDDDSMFSPTTSSLRPEVVTNKPHKIKKKTLAARSKTTVEKVTFSEKGDEHNLTKLNENKDFDENVNTEANILHKIAKTASFTRHLGGTRVTEVQMRGVRFSDSPQSSATERIFKPSASNTLSSNRLINSNYLNIADTTPKIADDAVTEPAAKNTIKFDSDEFGTTGQSDWVPLVSDRGSSDGWSPIAGFMKTTRVPVPENVETKRQILELNSVNPDSKRPPPSTMQTIVVADTVEGSAKPVQSETVDMDLPPGSASWALASSHFTRSSDNATEPPRRTSSPIIAALNSTLQRKIKDNLLSTLTESVTTEKFKSDNASKEHNQVLKNTIPDTIFVETTPDPKWRPIVTTTSSPLKPIILSEATPENSKKESITEVGKSMAYEIMKIATSAPTREIFRPTTQSTLFVQTNDKYVTEGSLRLTSQTPPTVSEMVATESTPAETKDILLLESTKKNVTLEISMSPLPQEKVVTEYSPLETTSKGEELTPGLDEISSSFAGKAEKVELALTEQVEKVGLAETESSYTESTSPSFLLVASSLPSKTTTNPTVTAATSTATTTFATTAPTLPSIKVVTEETTTIIPFATTSEESSSPSTSLRPTTSTETTSITSSTTSTTSTTTTTTSQTFYSTSEATSPPVITAQTTIIVDDAPTTINYTDTGNVFTVEDINEDTSSHDDSRTDDDNRTIITNATLSNDVFAISEENVPAYLRLTVQTSETELCNKLADLRSAILKMLSEGTNTNVTGESLVLLNLTPQICLPVLSDDRPENNEVKLRPVNMFLMDDAGGFNKNLSEAFLSLWGHAGLDFPLPILKVDFVTPIVGGEMSNSVSSGVVAAIAISCVAGLCLILLGILFVVMKRRQKKFNYGQRCTPVSLDAYSLDSVSIRNSGRRKGIRASKRSYGNAAFDDPELPSHILNFAGLSKFSIEKDQIHEEFSVIPQVSPRVDEYPSGVETKNRYANVIPLPETRVVLTSRDGDPLSDYINANFVKGLNNLERTYIAAQAPLDSTLSDWWRMVWEQQVRVILMLTSLSENGVEKCADYMPPSEVTDNIRLFGDFQVTLKKRDVKEKYIISTLQLKNMESSLWREVTHLWYLGWPDSGVPSEPSSLIAFLIEARSQIKTSSGSPAPTLVHCSPGTGRTGTVIACDVCIREFEQNRVVDIPKCVYHLRRARAGAVQTRDQYAFIYKVLNTYAAKLTGGALETI